MMLKASSKENHEVFVIFLTFVIKWCPIKYLFIFTMKVGMLNCIHRFVPMMF